MAPICTDDLLEKYSTVDYRREVANTDDTHGNSSSAGSLPVIYSYKRIASRRDRDEESVLFMLAKMF